MLLNINLAIINLLPIPVLDGGHILMAIIEKICRRPLSLKFVEYTTTGFAVLLISFMLYITFFDIKRLRCSAPCSQRRANRTIRAARRFRAGAHPSNLMRYCESHYFYQRRKTREVVIGDPANGGVIIGGGHPVVKQSMLTCDTMDTR